MWPIRDSGSGVQRATTTLQVMNPAAVEGTTILDALTDIENELLNPLGDWEWAKDLAEEINSKGTYF